MKCHCSNNLNLCLSNSQRNPGRLFFKCSKRECDFFQWANEYPKGKIRLWLEGEKFIHMFDGTIVKRKPQEVLFETPLQKGVREIVNKHMGPPNTTPKERLYLEKREMGPYEGNWHPEESKPLPFIGHMKKLEDINLQDLVRKEVEWHLYK